MEKLRIRELWEAREMSQQEVADYVGVSRVVISQWESGARKPMIQRLFKLAALPYSGGCLTKERRRTYGRARGRGEGP